MSVDQVRKWVKTNDYFEGGRVEQGNDVYVPGLGYPHAHIGPDYIVYSKSTGNHSYLIEQGGVIRKERIATALQDNKDPNVWQLLRYMSSQL